MVIEHKENKQELFEKWQSIAGENKILPLVSIDEYKNFHNNVRVFRGKEILIVKSHSLSHRGTRNQALDATAFIRNNSRGYIIIN